MRLVYRSCTARLASSPEQPVLYRFGGALVRLRVSKQVAVYVERHLDRAMTHEAL
jgi:hypothetical protein